MGKGEGGTAALVIRPWRWGGRESKREEKGRHGSPIKGGRKKCSFPGFGAWGGGGGEVLRLDMAKGKD